MQSNENPGVPLTEMCSERMKTRANFVACAKKFDVFCENALALSSYNNQTLGGQSPATVLATHQPWWRLVDGVGDTKKTPELLMDAIHVEHVRQPAGWISSASEQECFA